VKSAACSGGDAFVAMMEPANLWDLQVFLPKTSLSLNRLSLNTDSRSKASLKHKQQPRYDREHGRRNLLQSAVQIQLYQYEPSSWQGQLPQNWVFEQLATTRVEEAQN